MMEDWKETVDADLWSRYLSSCWWAIRVGFGNQIQNCCSQGEFHMEHVHCIHPFFIITLLSFLPCCAELLMSLHSFILGKVPLLVSLKYASVAIGWCTILKNEKKVMSVSWHRELFSFRRHIPERSLLEALITRPCFNHGSLFCRLRSETSWSN